MFTALTLTSSNHPIILPSLHKEKITATSTSCGPIEICPGLASKSWLVFCTASPLSFSLSWNEFTLHQQIQDLLGARTPHHPAAILGSFCWSQEYLRYHRGFTSALLHVLEYLLVPHLSQPALTRHTRPWSSSMVSAEESWIGPTGTGFPLPSSIRIRILPRRILTIHTVAKNTYHSRQVEKRVISQHVLILISYPQPFLLSHSLILKVGKWRQAIRLHDYMLCVSAQHHSHRHFQLLIFPNRVTAIPPGGALTTPQTWHVAVANSRTIWPGLFLLVRPCCTNG